MGENGDEPDDPADPNNDGGPKSKNCDMDTDSSDNSKSEPEPPKNPPSAGLGTSNHPATGNRRNSGVAAKEQQEQEEPESQELGDIQKEMITWPTAENPDEERGFNLLKEMELINDEGRFVYDHDTISVEVDEPQLQQDDCLEPHLLAGKNKRCKWGPVQGSRQCDMLQGYARKSILEMAQDNKKRKNLETPTTSKLKGLVANSENDQKVKVVVQGTHAGEDGPILPSSHYSTPRSKAHRVEMTGDISMAALADSLRATTSSGPLTPPSIDNTSASNLSRHSSAVRGRNRQVCYQLARRRSSGKSVEVTWPEHKQRKFSAEVLLSASSSFHSCVKIKLW